MKRLTTLVLMSFALFLGACASGPEIHSDYDRSVDFTEYKTFNFFNPMGIENPNYSSIAGSVFRDAITDELTRRGYTLADNPDLMINVSATLQDKTKVTTYNDPMYPGYYGYRRGFYDPWYGYGYGTETHVSQYTEGTVNIDMVDAARKRMVWEGVGIGRVSGKKTNEELRTAIRAGVAELFAEFPFTVSN
ncbi:DUF4136 domain-containing protein [Marinihelvus fidelis]|uniref:DUF4136 domain-containing protein n=1 Tax=Marinihelvus fidelis TaxID=2613842 RepID=A0A5N0T644_9GAMM|nr:DUF4136 domain-containing protein [Marinihelvus fidelis]KAA9130423.1 DUF4136 domain-containing protein [Marinihelvus fidelis]